jgi:uncharacterized protein YbjT (DUF2867 family)
MFLVTGAAGKTGRAIIQALSGQKFKVRAFVYRVEQKEIVESYGASEVVIGDLRDEDTFLQAAQGAQKIYHICPNVSPYEVEIGAMAIAAAQAACMDHFVYHSVIHPQTQKMPHHGLKLKVEELLLESGLPFTILQPTIYYQNILGGWEKILESGIYSVPYAVDMELSMVDLPDVAEVASRIVTEPGHTGATYELCSGNMISAEEIAKKLSENLGQRIRAERGSIQEWAHQAKRSGLGEYQIDALAKMFHYYDTYGLPGNDRVLRFLLGREPTGISAFIERVISSRV